MNASGPFSMEFLRPADVGAHCVCPWATKRRPYGSIERFSMFATGPFFNTKGKIKMKNFRGYFQGKKQKITNDNE